MVAKVSDVAAMVIAAALKVREVVMGSPFIWRHALFGQTFRYNTIA